MEIDPQILDVFLEELKDMIKILDTEINKYPSNSIAVNEIFRIFHTLKGNSATIEFCRLQKLTSHYCEYFRFKQKDSLLNEKEYTALKRCSSTLHRFQKRAKNGKKGKTIRIVPVIKALS